MTGLVEFLDARIRVDEIQAGINRAALVMDLAKRGVFNPVLTRLRDEAEAAAKRAILDDFTARVDGLGGLAAVAGVHAVRGYDVLQHLASVYDDHPDYQEEWKPNTGGAR